MDTLLAELQLLHPQSYGWALCCCRRDPHAAEDLLQRVYLKLLSGARPLRTASLKTWVFTIILTTAREERRRQWRHQRKLSTLWIRARASPQAINLPDTLEQLEQTTLFLKALDSLAPRQREVLHLVFYQDMSIAQAAQIMNLSIGSARTHYDRGKTRLARLLPNPQPQVAP